MYDDAQDALAAEYVLGTLSGDEREHAEALLAIDPGFSESVRVWERRLGELNVMVEAVEPPPAVWEKISTQIGYVAPAAAGASAPADATAAKPLAEAPTLPSGEMPAPVIVEQSKDEPLATMPSAEQLPDAVSDSITASLAKSLAEPPAEQTLPVAAPQAKIERPAEIERSANVVQLSRRVKRWRTTAIAMQAIAALLAIYVVAAQFYPNLIRLPGRTLPTQTAQAPAQLAARLVAVLQQEPTAPAFLLTVDPQSRTLIVRRVSATPEEGRSYELWLIAKGAPAPKSLGLVGDDEFTQRTIPGNFDLATLRSASYAVSLEPAGGSASGVPTGPVLFTGNIVESVPPAPRT
jgi:anti-sigma-K factor RskA